MSDATAGGTRVVQGYVISDPDLLAELGDPPAGESYVEVPDALLRGL